MIIVLNFGSQYTHLISRRIRELGCYSEILPFDSKVSQIKKFNPKGLILSGGPFSIYDKDALFPTKGIFKLNIPILGICYGQQLITKMLGGKVKRGKSGEYGRETITILEKSNLPPTTFQGDKFGQTDHTKSGGGLFKGLNKKEKVWFSHGDSVIKLPQNFKRIAESRTCRIAAFADDDNKIFGVQFHPEVTHTVHGLDILKNFIYDICREKKVWKIGDIKDNIIAKIQAQIGKKPVLIGVSGGVDSFVAAVLLQKAIGDNLYAVFIDNGLLRKKEADEIRKTFKKVGFKNFSFVDSSNEFLANLNNVIDPEKKRKIIGKTFIKVFERKVKEIEKEIKIEFLAQGTIYPDRIESAQPFNKAAKIKSHHNIALPRKLKFQIIEPIKDLYKDEVRKLGEKLGLPKSIIKRHPFPGPGLSIRILGEVTKERLSILREADSIFIAELKKAKLYDKIWQAFASLLPLKSVGVMGDTRTYEYIVSLRAVSSKDGMTADWAKIPGDVLEKISNRIINEVKGVNRVLYDISQKPPATIEYE